MQGIYRALGDIDHSTAEAFDVGLRDAIDDTDELPVSVDCSGVTFMDSAGYRVLVGTTEYAVCRGQTLVFRDPSSACALLIRLRDSNHQLRVDA